jgi:hypothetical protein
MASTLTSTDSGSKKVISKNDIPEEYTCLHDFAAMQYGPLMRKACRSDDEQELFTSAGQHYVRGCELTAKIALIAAVQARA